MIWKSLILCVTFWFLVNTLLESRKQENFQKKGIKDSSHSNKEKYRTFMICERGHILFCHLLGSLCTHHSLYGLHPSGPKYSLGQNALLNILKWTMLFNIFNFLGHLLSLCRCKNT